MRQFLRNRTMIWGTMNKKMATESVRQQLKEAAIEVSQLGGWSGFKSGEWLFRLMERNFRAFAQSAAMENFAAQYPGLTREQIAERMIEAASRKAALAGAVTGAAISADELVGLFTAGEAGVGIPLNIAIAATAICASVYVTAKIQLQLVARLGALYAAPLDVDDPADMLAIMEFAFGAGVSGLAAKKAAKHAGPFTRAAAGQYYAKKESFDVLRRIAKKLGYKLLRRSLVNGIVPGVSMFMGAMWNKRTTKMAGKNALAHFLKRPKPGDLTRT